MLDMLYRLFRNDGKNWRIYQVQADTMEVKPLCFARCGGTPFQVHTHVLLARFFRNYPKRRGARWYNERLLTKELLPKIVGFQKKWFKFLFVVTVYLYIEVLNENCTPSTAYGEWWYDDISSCWVCARALWQLNWCIK